MLILSYCCCCCFCVFFVVVVVVVVVFSVCVYVSFLILNILVNSYGHVGTVSSLFHTFNLGKLY